MAVGMEPKTMYRAVAMTNGQLLGASPWYANESAMHHALYSLGQRYQSAERVQVETSAATWTVEHQGTWAAEGGGWTAYLPDARRWATEAEAAAWLATRRCECHAGARPVDVSWSR